MSDNSHSQALCTASGMGEISRVREIIQTGNVDVNGKDGLVSTYILPNDVTSYIYIYMDIYLT